PPPDDPSYASSLNTSTARAWFPSQHVTSYQSGGIPTFNTSQTGGLGAIEEAEANSGASAWETRYGTRVDVLAASAYLLGPFSALLLLILETHNDYVRFHAYQSAILASPLLMLRALSSLLGFPAFLQSAFTVLIVILLFYMAWRAYIDAAQNGLSRFQLPVAGPLADRWVSEE
ncbi:hypothetical protein K474DRAFT_1593117, partial [Panus rudis PR-1116 ss-1]